MTDAASSSCCSCQALMEATKRQQLTTTSTGTLTSLCSVSSLPFDLVEEILCRLPVKFLLQLRCVCKSWNSLISRDPKFARKHLRLSTTHHHLVLSFSIPSPGEINVISYPLPSVFTTMNAMQLEYPPLDDRNYFLAGSCDGLLFFHINRRLALLWNPCIQKFKELPSLQIPQEDGRTIYGLGYDPFTDNYKVVAVFCYDYDPSFIKVCKTQVKVHTLGTDSWRRIQDFPSMFPPPIDGSGKFVSGTINWLASIDFTNFSSSCFIVSLDLGKETYQEILQPDYGSVVTVTLGVLRDCLCIFTYSNSLNHVWLMKEYGNKKSWTKLISLPHYFRGLVGFYFYKVVYIYADDQVLIEMEELMLFKSKLVVYDSKKHTFKVPEIQDIDGWMVPKVYVESLISPCF